MRSVTPPLRQPGARVAPRTGPIARFGSLGPLSQPKSLINLLAKLGEVEKNRLPPLGLRPRGGRRFLLTSPRFARRFVPDYKAVRVTLVDYHIFSFSSRKEVSIDLHAIR